MKRIMSVLLLGAIALVSAAQEIVYQIGKEITAINYGDGRMLLCWNNEDQTSLNGSHRLIDGYHSECILAEFKDGMYHGSYQHFKNEEIIPPKPPKIDSILKIQHSNQQLQPRTTPARDIIIEVFDTIPTNTEIYYYSPRMESENYSYRKELGSDNNFLDVTDIYNRTAITVPDTCEQGAKLLFRAQGYEPLDLPMNEVYGKSHITIQLIPKIYNSTAVLEEIIFRDTISIIEIINLHETPAKVFYGQCLPIYSEDGINHSDPYCAFACMGCYPEFNVAKEYYSGELDEFKKLYQFLKEGGNCALVISVDKRQIRDIEIEGCSNKALDNIRKSMLTTPQGSYQGTYDGYRFQYRINFAVP